MALSLSPAAVLRCSALVSFILLSSTLLYTALLCCSTLLCKALQCTALIWYFLLTLPFTGSWVIFRLLMSRGRRTRRDFPSPNLLISLRNDEETSHVWYWLKSAVAFAENTCIRRWLHESVFSYIVSHCITQHNSVLYCITLWFTVLYCIS